MRYVPRKKIWFKVKLTIWFIAILSIFVFTSMKIRPIIQTMSSYNVKMYATKVINNAVSKELAEDKISYNSLVKLSKNPDGFVSALETDVLAINRMKSNLTNAIMHDLTDIEYQDLRVPLGTLLGGQWLSGRGPKIHIKMMPAGNVNSELIHKFESAGINQTKHQIILKITSKMSAIIPGYSTSVDVVTDFSVAETVIVGKVPESFTDVEDGQSSKISKINDYSDK